MSSYSEEPMSEQKQILVIVIKVFHLPADALYIGKGDFNQIMRKLKLVDFFTLRFNLLL